jgi:hypothetical protein
MSMPNYLGNEHGDDYYNRCNAEADLPRVVGRNR